MAKLASLGVSAVMNTPDEMRVTMANEIDAIRPLVKAGLMKPT